MSNKLVSGKRTKKNISNNPVVNKKTDNFKDNSFIDSLLNKKSDKPQINKNVNNRSKQVDKRRQTGGNKSKKQQQMITNFHKAITSTNSDDVIVKMLDLREDDILKFYSNLEKMIGSEMSLNIRNQMSKDLQINSNITNKNALCPFCMESKSNCVILLCGHLLCHKCAKNINRCKYPCPKCKKPIKYIQYIVE